MQATKSQPIAAFLAILGLAALWFCCTVCSVSTRATTAGETGETDLHSCCHASVETAKQPGGPAHDQGMPCKLAMKSVALACSMQRTALVATAGELVPADWHVVMNLPAPFWVEYPFDGAQPNISPGEHAPSVPLPGPAVATLVSLHTMLTT